MIGIDENETPEHEKTLLHLLFKGANEIEAGECHDLGPVLAEADGMLTRSPCKGTAYPSDIRS